MVKVIRVLGLEDEKYGEEMQIKGKRKTKKFCKERRRQKLERSQLEEIDLLSILPLKFRKALYVFTI